MDHWKHMTRKQSTEVHNQGFRKNSDASPIDNMKKNPKVEDAMKLGKEIMEIQPLSMFNKQQQQLVTSLEKETQTTYHQFFSTNKIGVNLTERRQVLGDAIVSHTPKIYMFKEFLSLSPSFSFHGNQGVKLQSLESSSTDGDGKDSFVGVIPSTVCLKNESSVETDAMELDAFQKIHLSNLALCPSEQNATGEEARVKMANTGLPDMNEELPVLSDAANSMNNAGISTSRTQSLDVQNLLCYTQQPSVPTDVAFPDVLGPEPSSRCVKRLKLNTSDHFAHGTKSSKLGEVSSNRKANKMFSKMMDRSKTSSEPTVDRSCVRQELTLDQTATLFKKDNSSGDLVRKNQEMSTARSWIHRWSRQGNAYPNKKPGALVLCEPQSSKATMDELQKKQFPSIAAMALMGKTMNGFHHCEFKKSGSLIVWST